VKEGISHWQHKRERKRADKNRQRTREAEGAGSLSDGQIDTDTYTVTRGDRLSGRQQPTPVLYHAPAIYGWDQGCRVMRAEAKCVSLCGFFEQGRVPMAKGQIVSMRKANRRVPSVMCAVLKDKR
jgi:hypothetical protein